MPHFLIFPKLRAAHKLQGLTGAKEDIEHVLEICKLLEEENQRDYPRIEAWEALSSAALVTYSRCFHGGIRTPLAIDALETHSQDLHFAHQYFYDLRNKHIAHSVSKYEENKLVALVAITENSVVSVAEVRIEHRRMLGFSDSDLPVMREICAFWMNWIDENIKVEEVIVTKAIESTSMRIIDAWAKEPIPSALSENAHKTRRSAP